ncbi:histidinol-phosphate transaminase [candidate division KSB1 bacterium]|nr:histidinol-phosphate transaminase [candidate division KSB1 bacterium]
MIPNNFIQNIAPYNSRRPDVVAYDKRDNNVLKLDWNECIVAPSPKVINSILSFVRMKNALNWYPDVEAKALKEGLSRYVALPTNFIEVFNGSDAALEYITRVYLNQDSDVITPFPYYDNFRIYVLSCGAKIEIIKFDDPFKVELDKITKAISTKTKLIYIINPNNPTGVFINPEELKEIIFLHRNTLFVIDEAYYEFCGKTTASFVTTFNNLIVVRTFSKAFGLAGARCGYIISQPENIKAINKIRVGKSVNSIAQVAALAALRDIDYMKRYVNEVKKSKKFVVNYLKQKGYKCVDSHANFVLLRVDNPSKIVQLLERKDVYVRSRDTISQMKGFIRITIGTLEIAKRLCSILNSILN